jgi:transforming growth factor-beta-induced protein
MGLLLARSVLVCGVLRKGVMQNISGGVFNMKKFFFGTGALVLAIGLAGCGAAPSSTSGTTTDSTSVSGTTLDSTSVPSTSGTTTSEGTTGTTTSEGTTGTTTSEGTTGTTTSEGTTGTTTSEGTTGTTTAGTTTAGTTGTTTTETTGTLLEAIAADPRFSTLAGLLEQSGLAEQLEAAQPVTIFAPSNEAFAALPQSTLEALSQDPTQLQEILLYHVVSGALPSSDITGDTTVTTLAGSDLEISVAGGMVMINGTAQVTEPDMMVGENVIHVIDQVLIPDAAA